MDIFSYKTKIGTLSISAEENCITRINFGIAKSNNTESPTIKEAFMQISEYLAGEKKKFNINLKFSGTNFQMNVWNTLLKIPYGEIITYGEIARIIGRKKAYRAVGMACNMNPIPIIVPCHRVLGIGGNLTGYSGGIDIKKWLIQMEAANSLIVI